MYEEDHEEEWLINTTCSLNMTRRLEYIRNIKPVTSGRHVTFGNNANVTIQGYGVLTTGSF